MTSLSDYLVEQLNLVEECGLELEEDFVTKLIFAWVDYVIETDQYTEEEISVVLRESVMPNTNFSSLVHSAANDIYVNDL